MPKNTFFTAETTDDIQGQRHAGRSENIRWDRSDLKLGKFKFLDFLDCTDMSDTMNLQFRLSERIFVYNNTFTDTGPGNGYTPHQVVFGICSGIPGIFQVPGSVGSIFARSLRRIKSGIHQTQAQGAPSTLGGAFPYEPGDFVNFLGPRGRIGQGYRYFGKEYRVAHSGTQISSLSKEYISPTTRTRISFALKSALCPILNTIKCKTNLKVRFKLRTKRAKSHHK